ncbi:MAG: HEPN domain-containing protein [Lachnospiraceae bacterium]|nr:HEPN domain-containing protein [Lachnospiraceae bacterium]
MEGSIKELASVRLDRAKEMLVSAEENFKNDDLRTSLNRSYYAIFHAMRAMNCLDDFDSSKHSGVIAHFNQTYIKTGVIDTHFSQIIKGASFLREKSDYDDFYIVNRKEAEQQLIDAKEFVAVVGAYLVNGNN